ncbi:MAG: sulfite exporter TauE/SafE family protein [Fidelibacterota bacterium]
METDLNILLTAAIFIGIIHTVIGPDHYLPFIMIAKARNWSLGKTTSVTLLCGVGHVLGSVVLGMVGIALGVALGILEQVESVRSEWASWLLVGFGVAYATWGLRIGYRAREHTHVHHHNDNTHTHLHQHLGRHVHLHDEGKMLTTWALFIVFILGPCEPLIPILMYPAAQGSWSDILWVTLAFGITTVATMTGIVVVTSKGLLHIKLGLLERYIHAIAGVIIAISGLSIKLFGL